MRIFNKEVSCCEDCDYENKEFSCCQIDYSINNIKDCPFNKPITEEVIKGFGFVQNHTNTAKMYSIFKDTYSVFLYKDDKNYFEISNCHDAIKIHGSAVEWLFRGIINNPVELEFILRSIGVIE